MSDKPMSPEQWAFFVADIHHRFGAGSADVVRRFVRGEIADVKRHDAPELWGQARSDG